MKIRDALNDSSLPLLETEVLLSALLDKDRSFLKAFPETKLSTSQKIKLEGWLKRRKENEPIAYILGYQDFYGLRFKVDERVLIPRPETESIVDKALHFADSLTKTDPASQGELVIVDVGTGSGCIAISLAKHLPKSQVIATDKSSSALKVAIKNAKLHNTKVEFLKGDLLEPLNLKADIIVANLPYIPTSWIPKLQPEIMFEPKLALDGGKTGDDLYDKFFLQLPNNLKTHGKVFYEKDGRIYSEIY